MYRYLNCHSSSQKFYFYFICSSHCSFSIYISIYNIILCSVCERYYHFRELPSIFLSFSLVVNTSDNSRKQRSHNYVHIYNTPSLPISNRQYESLVRKTEMIIVHITM